MAHASIYKTSYSAFAVHHKVALYLSAMVKGVQSQKKSHAGKTAKIAASKSDHHVVDPAADAAKTQMLYHMREKRALKSAKRKTETGVGSGGTVTEQEDWQWLNTWLHEPVRKGIVPFVVSLAREGHIETAWKSDSSAPRENYLGLASRPSLSPT